MSLCYKCDVIMHGIMKYLNIMSEFDIVRISEITKVLKNNMFKTVDSAKTGHVGACCSSTELMSVLYFTDILRFDVNNPSHPNRDYVLVRGHVGPLRYNIFSLLGWLRPEEMTEYRKLGSRLCGHEDMTITPGVDITPSGSLGMLLSYAVGACIGFKQMKRQNRVFCFLGDGEEQEGNVSEAARHATNIKCTNLIVIIDANTKQLSTATKFTDGGSDLVTIWKGYGWDAFTVDGHDLEEIYEAFEYAIEYSKRGPVCIIANTIKGNGLQGAVDHYCGYHVYHNNDVHTPITATAKTLAILIPVSHDPQLEEIKIVVAKQDLGVYNEELPLMIAPIVLDSTDPQHDSYDYLIDFLIQLSKLPRRVYVLTADYPPRPLMNSQGQLNIPNLIYMNVGVREQHLCAMAHGLRTIDKTAIILLLCGDAFMYRCSDQVNVLAQSGDNVIIYNVQAGLSGAQNGATHQSSGQSGVFVTMPGIAIYEPASRNDWLYAMNRALVEPGPKYIRTHKSYPMNTLQQGNFYEITENTTNNWDYIIITSGMIVHNAVSAMKTLNTKGYLGKVINIVSLKDIKGIGKLISPLVPIFFFYNGNVEILSSMVCRRLCHENVRIGEIHERGFNLGVTGTIPDIMKHFGFDPESIASFITSYVD